jgi:hypothetical protein
MFAPRSFVSCVIATLVVSAGCAATLTRSYVFPGVDLRAYHSYAWESADSLSTGDARLDNNVLFAARVRASVDRELAQRGFERTESANPQLLVHFHATIEQRVDPPMRDQSTHIVDDPPMVYETGTLFIDFVDARRGGLVWRGWAEGALDDAIDHQALLYARVDAAVQQILRQLPQ